MNPYFGFPVIEYDGTNADDIVKALKLEEGDVVVCAPKPIICKAMAWQDIRFALDGEDT